MATDIQWFRKNELSPLFDQFDAAAQLDDIPEMCNVIERVHALILASDFDLSEFPEFSDRDQELMDRWQRPNRTDQWFPRELDSTPPKGISNTRYWLFSGNHCFVNATLQMLANSSIAPLIEQSALPILEPIQQALRLYASSEPVDPSQIRDSYLSTEVGINHSSQDDPFNLLSTILCHAGAQPVFQDRRLDARGHVLEEYPAASPAGRFRYAPTMLELTISPQRRNTIHNLLRDAFLNEIPNEPNTHMHHRLNNHPASLFLRARRYDEQQNKLASEIFGLEDSITIDAANTTYGNPLAYGLESVIIHKGDTIQGGHYVALTKKPDGVWYLANDQAIFRWDPQLRSWLDLNDRVVTPHDKKIAVEGAWTPEELARLGYIFHFERDLAREQSLAFRCHRLITGRHFPKILALGLAGAALVALYARVNKSPQISFPRLSS